MERTKCEQCGKWAIKQGTGIIYASYPAQCPQEYKCICGWRKDAGVLVGKTNEEIFREQWERAQSDTSQFIVSTGGANGTEIL